MKEGNSAKPKSILLTSSSKWEISFTTININGKQVGDDAGIDSAVFDIGVPVISLSSSMFENIGG